jgi:hypothetical protein
MVLGGGHGSLEAGDGVLLLRSKETSGGLLQRTYIQGEEWGGTRGLQRCFSSSQQSSVGFQMEWQLRGVKCGGGDGENLN